MDPIEAFIISLFSEIAAAVVKVVLTNMPAIVQAWHQASTSTAQNSTPIPQDLQSAISAEVKNELK